MAATILSIPLLSKPMQGRQETLPTRNPQVAAHGQTMTALA
jgi:hypothetical protein